MYEVACPRPARVVSDARVLSIKLPEDQNCSHPGQTWYSGGDVLGGEITFQPALSGASVVDVCFEGFSRTWTPNQIHVDQPFVNENHFLQQVESITSWPRSEDGPMKSPEIRTIPFKFKIPTRLPVASGASDVDPRLQELCPSMVAGNLHEQSSDGKLYMQPMIFYTLSASARPKGREPQRPRIDVVRRIAVMPTTKVPPPKYTSVFQDEYKLQTLSTFRKHFYSRSRGSLELTAEEPQPIDMLGPHPRSSTLIILKASFNRGENVSERTVEPYNWTFNIRTRLRRRLFYATKPLDHEPTLADAQNKSHIGLHTRILQSEEREYTNLPWRNNHISPHGTIVTAGDSPSPWTVMIPVVFTTDHSLIPSFFSATAALRYSVLLNVRIVGSWSSRAILEIPLQVICQSHASSEDVVPLSAQPSIQLLSFDDDEDEHEEDLRSELARQPPKYRRWAY